MSKYIHKYIDFSIDHNGNCDRIDDFIVDNKDVVINETDVQPLIEELKKIDGFNVSEYRTEVRIWWNENGTMDILYRYFNDSDSRDFDKHSLYPPTPINFEPCVV
jgi:hypothetical protein